MSLKSIKNQIRGVSGVLERKGFDAGKEKRISQANARIRKIFDEAKVGLGVGYYGDVFSFSNQAIKSTNLYEALNPLKLSRVKIVKKTKVDEVEREIAWASEKINFFSREINQYLKLKKIIDKRILCGEYVAATRALAKLERMLGESVWSAKKKVQIASLVGGFKEQKNVAEKIKREAGPGPVAFMIHQESIRIESNTNSGKYEADNQRRIKEYHKIKLMKNFLLHGVCCSHDYSNSALAEILAFSGLMSIIDYYESLVDVFFICALEKKISDDLALMLKNSAMKIKRISDERIIFILDKYGEKVSKNLYDSVKKIQIDVLDSSLLYSEKNEYSYYKDLGYSAINRIIYRENPDAAYDDLKKVCLSFSGHLYSVWILNLVNQDRNRNKLNFILDGSFHIRYGCLVDGVHKKLDVGCRSVLLNAVLDRCESLEGCSWVNDAFYNAAEELKKLFEGGDRELFHSYYSAQETITRSYVLDSLIGSLSKGFTSEFLRMVASERVRDDGCHNYLNIVELFSGYPWSFFSEVDDVLDRAVFFDYIHNRTGESRLETYKRFSLEDVLRTYRSSDIDDFLSKVDKSDKRIRVVLKNVCVPSILDMLEVVNNSKEVYKIRKKVCDFIVDSYGEDESITAEIDNIDAVIRLNEISDFVDSNKVFVDEDGMAAWNKRNLKQDFERFLSLVDPSKKSKVSFEELLIGQIYDPLLMSSADIDESDIQLYDMLEKMKKQFLFDPSFGLDGYLSKRVRHNTLHIFLRSSFSDANFVTLKDKGGKLYKDSLYWTERLGHIDVTDKDFIISALKRFSDSFDSEVMRIVDDYLHVNSADKPKGILKIPLTDTYLLTLKSSAIEHESLATLSAHVTTAFWTLLKPSLDDVKILLRENFRASVDTFFDALQASVRKVSVKYPEDECIRDLGTEITRSHSVLIDNIDRAANWFSQSRAELKSVPQNVHDIFTTLIDYVNGQFSGRDPDCTLECDEKIEMQFHNVLIIADVVKDILENIYSHCGVDRGVKIIINVEPNSEMNSLKIFVVNSLSMSALNKARSMDKEKIITRMKTGEWKSYVRKEGDSGLYKIWSSSAASGDANMDFGVSSDNKFYVHLDLPLIGKVTR